MMRPSALAVACLVVLACSGHVARAQAPVNKMCPVMTLEARFQALRAKLDLMRQELEDSRQHGRQLEDTLLRKGCLYG